jgi:hypothetical protein
MKIVKKRLADGTIKIYEYGSERYRGGRLAQTTPRCEAAARRALAVHGLPAGPPILLYFIQTASGPIKIGITDNLARRLDQVTRVAFEDVKLLAVFRGSRDLEKRLHNSLARHRLKNDWFSPHEHVMRALSDLQDQSDRRLRKPKWKPEKDDPQAVAV